MKRHTYIFLLACLVSVVPAWGGDGNGAIDAILEQIAVHNKQLQADARRVAAQKQENKAANNLPDPTLSYAHLWDSRDKNITVGELVIAQSFEFPTRYATRNRQNRHRAGSLDAQADALRQQVLLQAKEACLDIVMLHRQQQLLDTRLRNAEELADMYARRLETGDANVLETNKINLELLNVRTESRLNRIALENKLKELAVLNGDQPLVPGRPGPDGPAAPNALNLGLTDYPEVVLPADFGALCAELLAADPTLQALSADHSAALRQVSLSKQGWLPRLELGYRRNTEDRHPLNGIVVGFSFPIFENRGKVKTAKAQALDLDYQQQNARLTAESALWQLYDEARSLSQSIDEYRRTFGHQQDLSLLRQALDGGEISMIEYFVEVSVVYQSQANLLQLENQYQKAVARIYKSRL